jgi:hypothetical protein
MEGAMKNNPWRLAHSLRVLREQLDEIAPERSKESDGSIGDARHQSKRSDHNPWIKGIQNGHPMGIVSAIDITHDPEHGCDCSVLANLLMHDSRVKYLIFRKKIWNPSISQYWRRYSGVNPHVKHLHVSVMPEVKFFDDTKAWPLESLYKR